MISLFKKKEVVEPTPVVVPRIKHENFLIAVNSIPDMNDASKPITERLAGDLLLTYAVDRGSNYVAVTPSCLEGLKVQPYELRALAETSALEAMRNIHVRTNSIVHEMTAPDNMAACTILYSGLWQQIEREMGGPVVAAFPHRDFSLYASADAKGITALIEAIGEVDFEENHALSKLLYRPTSDGWEVVAP